MVNLYSLLLLLMGLVTTPLWRGRTWGICMYTIARGIVRVSHLPPYIIYLFILFIADETSSGVASLAGSENSSDIWDTDPITTTTTISSLREKNEIGSNDVHHLSPLPINGKNSMLETDKTEDFLLNVEVKLFFFYLCISFYYINFRRSLVYWSILLTRELVCCGIVGSKFLWWT